MVDRRRDNLLRLADVKARTGLARTTIYNRMKAGTFPPSLQISPGLVAWYESDIDAWVSDPMGWRSAA
ncbi:AlpA family phage regulatory protein [Novosphingobium sp. FGD1]|uniref:AlpA family phage regulatory protein n=1 Tax=Novosphingobium silvae TaxID=2692619 RepID=A0A7X4GFX6_9SPHN|nr:AlpA family phage regulatory protein [Novosphingobium silvae]MYL97920.1 AlpA family phage regulatory protein [Novosphingobium silvae]